MLFEPENQFAKKSEDQLSQTENAQRLRKRHAKKAAAKAAEKRRQEVEHVRKRADWIQRFGEDRVANWEAACICGNTAYDLCSFFLGNSTEWITDETLDADIELVSGMDGWYVRDSEMPETSWDRWSREYGEHGRRLGLYVWPRIGDVRNFFTNLLCRYRGLEIQKELPVPPPVAPESPTPVAPVVAATRYETTPPLPPPEPPARAVIPVEVHDALARFMTQTNNRQG